MNGTVVLGVTDGLVRMPVADAAAAFAARTGRSMRVVHVHTGPHQTWDGDAGLRTQAYLDRTAPRLPVGRSCTVGDPAAALLDAARRPEDILVIGNRRVRLGALAGRTTLDVVTGTACPVLVVPEYRVLAGGVSRRGGVVAAPDGEAGEEAVVAMAGDAAHTGSTPELVDAATGSADESLAAAARGAGLLVVGLPAADRPDSAAVRLLADQPCPVLLVPGEKSRAAAPVTVSEAGSAR